MPRFFIDIGDRQVLLHDETGEELADSGAAKDMALAVLPDLARDALPRGDDHAIFAIVRDDGGNVIFTATLTLAGWQLKDTGPSSA